ncbi:MAG: TIGR02452 family protein [Lachnospiraceae bacterium]|nr:TIGR02452 family protein [Lachnospiraceae bacterium]
MKDRNERVAIFNETMRLCRESPKLAETVRQSIREQKIYWQEDEVFYDSDGSNSSPKCTLSRKRTLEAARSYAMQKNKKVCVLNFASSVTPGGGVTRGASAQEESMCRISTLYPAISDKATAGRFYEKHWQMIHDGTMGRENRDDCIYTPGVIVMREDTFDCALMPEEDWYAVDVITCAAPDQRGAGFGALQQKSGQLMQLFEKRFSKILSVAAHNQVDILILGAFGCGAFCNPPEIVVRAFNNIISDFNGTSLKEIEFAVFANNPTNGNYQAFKKIKDIEEAPAAAGDR